MNSTIVTVSTKQESSECPVHIGQGLLARLKEILPLDDYSSICVVSDKTIAKIWMPKLEHGLERQLPCIQIEPGEAAKSLETCQQLWLQFKELGLDRRSLVINLGGGVVSDLGGFAAATFMRGLDFVQIPTTLLSQVDASIGGKVGIDFVGVKNLIGTIRQPRAIVIDVDTLSTLNKREFSSGFAEMVKHGLTFDREYFSHLAELNLKQLPTQSLIKIIQRSVEIKAAVVAEDTVDDHKRRVLNFGHTIGHALEAIALERNISLLHGEAVSLGLLAESVISQELGFINDPDLDFIERCLANFSLPLRLPFEVSPQELSAKIKFDKKNSGGKVNWTVLQAIGQATYDQQVPGELVERALAYLND